MATLTSQGKRKIRVRSKIKNYNRSLRNRILFYVSNKHMYAQLLEVSTGNTLITISSSSDSMKDVKGNNKESAEKMAEIFSTLVKEKDKDGFDRGYIFDRGAKPYHGKVKAFADKLRESGLKL